MSDMTTVRSPFDGHEIGEVPALDAEDVHAAVERAKSARQSQLPTWRRAEILYEASLKMSERREEFAQIVAEEAAKPIATARIEAERAISTLGWSSIAARNLKGEMVPMDSSMVAEGKLAYTLRVPIGIVGAIAPFNFPLNLVCHKVGPAIAAGCPVILKPASQTPFSSIALSELLTDCGLPDDWLHVVTGSGNEVGGAILDNDDVAFVSFTGSADVGWGLAQKAPRKRIRLELGNSTPVIVMANSQWREAAERIAVGGFSHAGQSCISVQRVYVQREISEDFTAYFVERVKDLRVGDPMDDSVNVSSLISEMERDRVKSWIDEAVEAGAQIECGGEIDGSILQPTVLSNTNLGMKVCKDEVFGPVVSIAEFDSLDQALELANGTRYGLQAGVYANDIAEAMQATRELDFGGVTVNETPTWRADVMPYGGVKDSGNTREGPSYAVDEMSEQRLVIINS